MHGVEFRLQLGILPFQQAYPLIPAFQLAITAIEDPQVVLVDLGGVSVLFQNPRGGQAVEIGAGVLVHACKIRGRLRDARHAYRFSRFRISQLTLESAWIKVQSLL
jgi:hypothetical protein